MLAKMTSKNQLTLPKSVTRAVSATDYFDVEVRAGQIILTPVRIQRADLVRAKLAELHLSDGDVSDAVSWARDTRTEAAMAAEPVSPYKDGVPKRAGAPGATRGAARKTAAKP